MHLAPRVACWSRSALRNPTVLASTVLSSTVCEPAASVAPGGDPWD